MSGSLLLATDNTDQVTNVPLVITKSKFQNNDAPIALLISGDGGWYRFEQSIADRLANIGIPTLGLDSRKYFWERKSPEETAAYITKELLRYAKEWGRKKFLLIGYSFGAEVVPFLITRFPRELRSEVVSAVLLSPETTTDFEIHISNMLGLGNPKDIYKVTDEIVKAQMVPILIIYGDGEKSKVPALLSGTTVKVVKIPGDHHYKSNETLIVETMKANKAF